MIIKRPGAGKIAVRPLDLSQELDITQVDGRQIRLTVIASDNHEGIVAEVISVCKPWTTAGAPDQIFNPEYDVGEIVVIGKWTGSRLNIDRESFIIVREEDVLCTLEKKPAYNHPIVDDNEVLDEDDDVSDKQFNSEALGGTSSEV